jgi:hypothetical protein
MEAKTINVNDHTMIVVKTHADLDLQGTDEMEIRAITEEPRGAAMNQEEDVVRVQSRSDLDLTVPKNASISVERVSGDANIRQLEGSLQIQRVGGDLSIQDIGPTEVMSVGGDVKIHTSEGALSIQRIGADFTGAELSGPVRLEGLPKSAIKLCAWMQGATFCWYCLRMPTSLWTCTPAVTISPWNWQGKARTSRSARSL